MRPLLINIGYLHLAYLCTEITLHRHLLRSLSSESNPQLINVVRTAAHARLTSATDFVKSLRPEHLQSFWYCASTYCFSLIGSYIGLMWATSRTKAEAESYRERLDEYRWNLRLSSRSAEILEMAAGLVAASTAVLVKGLPAHLDVESNDDGQDYDEDSDGDDNDKAMTTVEGETATDQEYESSARQYSVDNEANGTVASTTTTSPVMASAAAGANGRTWDPDDLGSMQLTSPTEYHHGGVHNSGGHLDLFWPELALPGSGYEVVSTEYVHQMDPNADNGSGGQWS
jgi:hypothetical protein